MSVSDIEIERNIKEEEKRKGQEVTQIPGSVFIPENSTDFGSLWVGRYSVAASRVPACFREL